MPATARFLLSWLVAGLGLILSVGAVTPVASAAQGSQEEADPALLLILDSSGSMRADDGTGRPKIAAAKEALNRLVDSLPEGSLVGLRVYGHRVPNTDKARGCKDTELIVPVGPLERAAMKQRVASFDAKGFTPIGLSLLRAAQDLPDEGERTIVLVSDGIDTCAPPPPCEVARDISNQGIDLRIDTVGFQVDPAARAQLQCIARVAKGSYVDANSADELAAQLEKISLRALRAFRVSGEPVEGTSDPTTAPVLDPEVGEYTDHLSARDGTLYYAVDLAAGQSVEASITMVGNRRGPQSREGAIQLRLLDPNQQQTEFQIATDLGRQARTVQVAGGPVGLPESEFLYTEAGTYYLELSIANAGALGSNEYPTEINVAVTGEPPATTSATPTEEGEAPPPASDDDTPEAQSELELVEAAGAVGFALLGLVVGALAGRGVVRLLG